MVSAASPAGTSSRPANAPRGNGRAAALPWAQTTVAPRPPGTASASRASRVLPTPAGPATTIPAAPGRIAAATLRSSSSRPVSGHGRSMASG